MVSNRIAASAELARLRKLQEILRDFVQQMQDLLGPFVPEEEEEEEEEEDQEEEQAEPEPVQQRAPAPRPPVIVQPQPRILQLQAQGAGMKGLSKVPSKTMQRRPLMKPRAQPLLSPIPPSTPQPRRTPERMPQPTAQSTPQITVVPATKPHVKAPVPVTVDQNRLSPLVVPKRTKPAAAPAPRARIASPYNRSFDTTPKYLNETSGQSKTLGYKPTRLDVVKRTPVLDLVQKITNLEERVQRAASPPYRPMSPGSPGRDNLPFNRTYTIVADTSFQAADKNDAKIIQEMVQVDSEDEEDPQTAELDLIDEEVQNTLVQLYVNKIDEKWDIIEKLFCTGKSTSR